MSQKNGMSPVETAGVGDPEYTELLNEWVEGLSEEQLCALLAFASNVLHTKLTEGWKDGGATDNPAAQDAAVAHNEDEAPALPLEKAIEKAIEKAPPAALPAADGHVPITQLREVTAEQLEQLPELWDILVGGRAWSYDGGIDPAVGDPWGGALLNSNGGLDLTDLVGATTLDLLEAYGALPFTLSPPGRLLGRGDSFDPAGLPAWMLAALEGYQGSVTFGELLDTMGVPQDVQQAMAAAVPEPPKKRVPGKATLADFTADELNAWPSKLELRVGDWEGKRYDPVDDFDDPDEPANQWYFTFDPLGPNGKSRELTPEEDADPKLDDLEAITTADLLERLGGQVVAIVWPQWRNQWYGYEVPEYLRPYFNATQLKELAENWERCKVLEAEQAERRRQQELVEGTEELKRGCYYGHVSVELLDGLLTNWGKPQYSQLAKQAKGCWTIHAGETSWHGGTKTIVKVKTPVWLRNGGSEALTSEQFIEKYLRYTVRIESRGLEALAPPKWAKNLIVNHGGGVKDAGLPLPELKGAADG